MRTLASLLLVMFLLVGCNENPQEKAGSQFAQPQKSEELNSPTKEGSKKLDKALEKAYKNNSLTVD